LGYDKLLVMNATLATLKRVYSLLSVARTFGGSYESRTPTLNAATNEHDAGHVSESAWRQVDTMDRGGNDFDGRDCGGCYRKNAANSPIMRLRLC
jgi:hypothetical protein